MTTQGRWFYALRWFFSERKDNVSTNERTPRQSEVLKGVRRTLFTVYRREYAQLWTSQQDNCSIHVSDKAKSWFNEQEFRVMTWPLRSADLNPIENL